MTFVCNGTASEHALSALNRLFGYDVPSDYIRFLRQCNGGEGFTNDEYLMLWRAEDIEQFNGEYEVPQYLSGVILFGSNGGGEAFGFRRQETGWGVIRVPFVGMDAELIEVVAESFSQFMSSVGMS